jgi:hypothetical protein
MMPWEYVLTDRLDEFTYTPTANPKPIPTTGTTRIQFQRLFEATTDVCRHRNHGRVYLVNLCDNWNGSNRFMVRT